MKIEIGLTPTFLILVGCVVLLQVHGILFWTSHVGMIGWAWSILLECVALWLWYQPSKTHRTLAFVASCLTLAGPIYHVAEPSIDLIYGNQASHEQREVAIDLLRKEYTLLNDQLVTFQRNSAERTGWLPAIEQANSRILEINRELIDLSGARPETQSWLSHWAIIMKILVLILFQLVAVFSILKISSKLEGKSQQKRASMEPEKEKHHQNMEKKVSPMAGKIVERKKENIFINQGFPSGKSAVGNSEKEESLVSNESESEKDERETSVQGTQDPLRILEMLETHTVSRGETFSAFGKRNGISNKDLSFLKRHTERVAANERTISTNALEKIIAALESERISA